MSFGRRLGTALAIVVLALICILPAHAYKPRISLGASGTVAINGKTAIHFQTGNGQLSADGRAELTYQRLAQLINEGVSPGAIVAKGNKRQAKVMAGDTVICIATGADARKAHTNRLAVASIWAAGIRRQLSIPPLTLSDNDLTIPLGETRRVRIGGAATGPIYASSDNMAIAAVEVGKDGRYIDVAGKLTGRALIDVCVDGERALVSVGVRKYAGGMSATTVAKVTGNPCPVSLISYAVRQAATRGAVLETGANLEIGRIVHPNSGLTPGNKATATVDVRISGPGYLTYSGLVPVEVRNIHMPREEADQLFYSNDPERLAKYQVLYAGALDPDRPTRLLYHHQNMMRKRVHLIVEIINPSEAPAEFRVLGGIASPSEDTVGVGHIAGAAFLRAYQDNIGVIEIVPPRSRLILVSNMLGHQDTASGILQITNQDGERAFVKITAAEPGVDNVYRGMIARAPDPLILPASEEVYPNPKKTLDAHYVVGEQWAFIPLGKHALDDTNAQSKLYGNYGVLYYINVKMENQTGETRTVSVVFDPTAGIASGSFVVDGRFVQVRAAQPPDEVPVASYRLAPGQTKSIRIITVPLAGSNYPANLVVRS